MNILITNDDGVLSEGITALANSLKKLGEVWLVAPDRERNAISHALTLHRPLRINNLSSRHYAINGTPADCVNIGIHYLLQEKPALIVSGINKGANLGNDINYSGTVAAGVEGALMGIPSFAISLEGKQNFRFEPAANFALRLARFVLNKGLPPQTLLNVNVPNTDGQEIHEYLLTHQDIQARMNTIEEKSDPRGGRYYWIGRIHDGVEKDPANGKSDLEALRKKII
ncbi:MAG: 5'/3'-nucleotidase SurE, partial [Thermodesulfobacteriota bacterium]|nr:5'/3'-nucleotidase SurE [Thermodesulfobacteriota bacterium]